MRQADEAWGSRLVPLDDEGLIAKFLGLVEPVFGEARAKELSERLWTIDRHDVAPRSNVASRRCVRASAGECAEGCV